MRSSVGAIEHIRMSYYYPCLHRPMFLQVKSTRHPNRWVYCFRSDLEFDNSARLREMGIASQSRNDHASSPTPNSVIWVKLGG